MYGETSDYETAKNLLKEAKSKGYNSAFLVAFNNGTKISNFTIQSSRDKGIHVGWYVFYADIENNIIQSKFN